MKRREEDGFALITTLLFLVLLAFVAIIVESWITTSLGRAGALNERITAEQELDEATNRAVFTMLTNGFGAPGLVPVSSASPIADPPVNASTLPKPNGPFVALDNRAYRLGNVVIRLQDEGGLYDLSNPDRTSLTRLLRVFGITAADGDAMAVELSQYQTDRPDPQTAPGRDAEYASAGLLPPRQSRLISPWEAFRILHWPHSAVLWSGQPGFADLVTTGPVGGVGINTAPAPVLMASTGMDEKEAARLIAARQSAPISNLAELRKTDTSIALPVEQSPSTLPSNIIRLRLVTAGSPLVRIVSIRLTPRGTTPYRLDFSIDQPPDAIDRSLVSAAIPPLPLLSNQ